MKDEDERVLDDIEHHWSFRWLASEALLSESEVRDVLYLIKRVRDLEARWDAFRGRVCDKSDEDCLDYDGEHPFHENAVVRAFAKGQEVARRTIAVGQKADVMELEWGPTSPTLTWVKAKVWCEALGNGWRMPTIDELWSAFDRESGKPRGKGWKPYVYWSSTTYSDGPDFAWSVLFNYGDTYADFKTDVFHVRGVRGGSSK